MIRLSKSSAKDYGIVTPAKRWPRMMNRWEKEYFGILEAAKMGGNILAVHYEGRRIEIQACRQTRFSSDPRKEPT